MTYQLFRRLCGEAMDYTDIEMYIAERGFQDWMALYNNDENRIVQALNLIYSMAHGGFPGIRAATGLSQAQFAAAYGVPRRSVENWDTGVRTPPDYAMLLLAFAVFANLMQAA